MYPEKDMGRRVAHLVRGAAMDYLEIEPGYSLAKITAPPDYQGAALGATNLRQAHGVTVTAFKRKGGPVGQRRQSDGAVARATRSSSWARPIASRPSRSCS